MPIGIGDALSLTDDKVFTEAVSSWAVSAVARGGGGGGMPPTAAIDVILTSQSNVSLYVDPSIDASDVSVSRALHLATRLLLCGGALTCDVAARVPPSSTLRRRRRRRHLEGATSNDRELLAQNDTIVAFHAERHRLAHVVLAAPSDVASALYDSLLTTSLAPQANLVRLGPSYFTTLSAAVIVTASADGEVAVAAGVKPATPSDGLLAALSNLTSLQATLARTLNRTSVLVEASRPTYAPVPFVLTSAPPPPHDPTLELPAELSELSVGSMGGVSAAAQREIDEMSALVSSGLTLSVALAITTSVASTVMSVVGAAAGGASVAGAGSGSAGGGVAPLLMGVQSFCAVSSGLAIGVGDMQSAVASSLEWAGGTLPILPPASPSNASFADEGAPSSSPSSARRRLGSSSTAGIEVDPMDAAMVKLLNTLLTFLMALSLTLLIHAIFISLWRHAINRRYYAWQRRVEVIADERAAITAAAKSTRKPSRTRIGQRKVPKFFPWPKSLVWPTPLVFTCCMFATGLTRAATMVLALRPLACDRSCTGNQALAGSLLVAMWSLALLLAVDLCAFQRSSFGKHLLWKPATKLVAPAEVADPWFRMHAKLSRKLARTTRRASRPAAASNGLRGASSSSMASLIRNRSSKRACGAGGNSGTLGGLAGVVAGAGNLAGLTGGHSQARRRRLGSWIGLGAARVTFGRSDGARVHPHPIAANHDPHTCGRSTPYPPPAPPHPPPTPPQSPPQTPPRPPPHPPPHAPAHAPAHKPPDALPSPPPPPVENQPWCRAMEGVNSSAIRLQKRIRVRSARRETRTRRDAQAREAAAARIQAVVRGKLCRRERERRRLERGSCDAANTLQRMVRNRQLRRTHGWSRLQSVLSVTQLDGSRLDEGFISVVEQARRVPPLQSAQVGTQTSATPSHHGHDPMTLMSQAPLPPLHTCAETRPALPVEVTGGAAPPAVSAARLRIPMLARPLTLGLLVSSSAASRRDAACETGQQPRRQTATTITATSNGTDSANSADATGTTEDETPPVEPAADPRADPPAPPPPATLCDRKSGAYGGLPKEEIEEPARTERLLASPFALRRACATDAWQAREGFMMFRVHGAGRASRFFRLALLLVNMLFGTLSGLRPLIRPRSSAAYAQSGVVLCLQIGMSFVCCTWLPDADRLISRFMGTKFLLEGTSTAVLLLTAVSTASAPLGSHPDLAFRLALSAMAVPVVQLAEQRCLTPIYGVLYSRSCNAAALCAALYMLGMSLPRQIKKIGLFIAGHQAKEGDGGGDAQEDLADNAEDGEGGEAEPLKRSGSNVEASSEQIEEAVAKAAKLAARAIAAKEMAAKQMAAAKPPPPPEASQSVRAGSGVFESACAPIRFAAQLKRRQPRRVDVEDLGEMEGGAYNGGGCDGNDGGGGI